MYVYMYVCVHVCIACSYMYVCVHIYMRVAVCVIYCYVHKQLINKVISYLGKFQGLIWFIDK